MRAGARIALMALVLHAPANAQGTLSTQGLGYPPGLLSARAQAMGGAIGESDPMSPLNPAAISLLSAPYVSMQAEPEYRELRVAGQKQRTSVARFPLFTGSMPIGTRWAAMVSAATLFDRTWAVTARDSQVIGADTIRSTRSQLSDGSIADLRFAVAYDVNRWLRVGVAGHAYSGRDDLRMIRLFDDTLRFTGDTQRTVLGFGGNAISVGAQTVWPRIGALGVSYRRGGSISTYHGDVAAHTASAPDHFGVSFMYLGIQGTTLAARLATDSWSRLEGLTPTLQAHEGLDIGLGADVTGPSFAGASMLLRLGGRWRTLPFSPGATAVKERTYSAGVGLPFAVQRAELNIAVLRSSRSGPPNLSENAWTISTGFSVRP